MLLVFITMNRDIVGLNPRLLLAFEAIMTERNVTAAADRLGLTQQGMSGQLARLRQEFDDPLFVRGASGVIPTPRAIELMPLVTAGLDALRRIALSENFNPLTLKGSVSIAASDYAQALLLPMFLKNIREVAPEIQVVIRPVDAEILAGELENGRVDLALTVPQFSPSGLASKLLFEETYVGVVRKEHPALQSGTMSLDDFCHYPHLLVAPFRGDAFGPTDKALSSRGRSRKIALIVPGFSVCGALLEQSDLISVLPERLLGTMKREITRFKLPIDVEGFRVVMVWSERLKESRSHIWLRETLLNAVKDLIEPLNYGHSSN